MPRQLPDTAICLGCGYSLRGLPSFICPECGRAFNPEDSTTYRANAVLTTWRRWAQPPGTWHSLTVLVVTLLLLDAWSGGTGGLGLGLLSCGLTLTLGPILVVVYLARVVAVCADRMRADRDRGQRLRPGKLRWLVTPICLGLVISACLARWPMRLRFAASRRALEAEANRLLAQAGSAAGANPFFSVTYNRFVGLYYVHYAHVVQDPPSVHFITEPGLFESWGFVYSPQQPWGTNMGLPDGWDFGED